MHPAGCKAAQCRPACRHAATDAARRIPWAAAPAQLDSGVSLLRDAFQQQHLLLLRLLRLALLPRRRGPVPFALVALSSYRRVADAAAEQPLARHPVAHAELGGVLPPPRRGGARRLRRRVLSSGPRIGRRAASLRLRCRRRRC